MPRLLRSPALQQRMRSLAVYRTYYIGREVVGTTSRATAITGRESLLPEAMGGGGGACAAFFVGEGSGKVAPENVLLSTNSAELVLFFAGYF